MDILLKWSKDNILSQVTISSGGENLFFGDTKLVANEKVTITYNDKTVSYTLASIFLQIRDPDQGLMVYRNACKKHNVSDPIKALDKPLIVGYFLGTTATTATDAGDAATADVTATAAASASTEDVTAATVAVNDNKELSTPSQANSLKAAQIVADAASDIVRKISSERKRTSTSDRDRDRAHRSSSDRKDRDHHHRREKYRSGSKDPSKTGKRSSSSSSHHHHHQSSKKKPRTAEKVTQEQLLSNLNVVVDKRQLPTSERKRAGDNANDNNNINDAENDFNKTNQKDYDANDQLMNDKIKTALSSEGFQVTTDLLQQYRNISQEISEHEIPVGNSASILRAAKSMNADLTRVLTLYMDATNSSRGSSSSRLQMSKGGSRGGNTGSGGGSTNPNFKQYLIGKKPIIILPKGMTAPVTMVNGNDFFSKAKFTPRQVVLKNKASQANLTTFSRKTKSGKVMEYELCDNVRKIHTPKHPKDDWQKDWERVCCVIVLGQSWQFKDWPGQYKDPVFLFQKTFGYHIRYDGDTIPKELQGWAVKQGKLHREKRQMDTITHSSFWNALDEWMAIHKPEFMIASEEN